MTYIFLVFVNVPTRDRFGVGNDATRHCKKSPGWVQAKAARLLNMTPRQIAYRIQTLNIEVKQF